MFKITEPVIAMTQAELDAIQKCRAGGEEFALRIALKAIQLYAETHPRPPHVNQQQAATMLHLSHVTVRKMIRAGDIKTNAAGLIPISEIDRAIAIREN